MSEPFLKSGRVKQRRRIPMGMLVVRLAVLFGLVCLVSTVVMLAG